MFRTQRMWTVARTELRQLLQAKDFWVPMALLGGIFFVVIPMIILSIINGVGNQQAVQQVSQALDLLPQSAKDAVPKGIPPEAQVSYTLAVFLLAPVAVVVPLTISSAVGASTIVGERERGTGEFLAHSPADTREIYLGKLIASLVPGYLTTVIGFTAYSILVNAILAGKVGYLFFPTPSWWLLIVWVLPPFIALALSLVLRLSARVKSTAAAQQATGLVTLPLILIGYAQATGALVGADTLKLSLIIGAVAWVIAGISLVTGVRSIKRSALLGVANEQ
ncbi:MAG: ABC transporter permease subunit [Acidimicrobiales bacterium]